MKYYYSEFHAAKVRLDGEKAFGKLDGETQERPLAIDSKVVTDAVRDTEITEEQYNSQEEIGGSDDTAEGGQNPQDQETEDE